MNDHYKQTEISLVNPDAGMRSSLWLMTLAMVFIIGLKSHGGPMDGVQWHHLGWPMLAASLIIAFKLCKGNWWRTTVLLAYLITLLFFTNINGDTSNGHVLELALSLGVGVLVIPALAARYWLKQDLDYSWFHGRWSLHMWLWFPIGFILAFAFLYVYFHYWTPTLHHSWPLPLEGARAGALWRLFWGCNFIGVWDELAFINFVFVLLCRHFSFREANLAQAVFFTSFLHEMAFVGWGPVVIFIFALVQGLTYKKTQSLFFIIILHLMIDSILFYMIANRWYPGLGWHPWA